MTNEKNACIVFSLCLENAEQRNLDAALYYAKWLLKLEAGSSVKGWILFARILSSQKRYFDTENIIDTALDEAGKCDQGELLRTKAKLQIAQDRLRDAIETYTRLLAVLQVQRKSFGVCKNLFKVYSEAKYLHKEALKVFEKALDIEPNHVPSLISTAVVLRQLSEQSQPIVKSFLTDALHLERTNATAWYNLGLLYKTGSEALALEAAALLQEPEPVEPFRDM